jgi:hypothetical protein
MHRAEGATEERIRQILGASIWLTIQEVQDPEVRAWLCEEFSKAAPSAYHQQLPWMFDDPLRNAVDTPYPTPNYQAAQAEVRGSGL